MTDAPRNFISEPYAYHQELELTIETLTNLGHGLARDDGWVVMTPFALPGERVRVRVFRNHKNYSDADLVEVLEPSPQRVEPPCPLFGDCGGCQYQHFDYEGQKEWKRGQVAELMERLGGISDVPVEPTHGSPKEYHYRSKLTPHHPGKKARTFEIGFQRYGRRNSLIDVKQCPIATEAINEALPIERANILAKKDKFKRGSTLLLRDTLEGVITDPRETVSEKVRGIVFQFKAGEFFQNNPYILPEMIDYVLAEIGRDPQRYLVDAYCGVGVFALSAARDFEQVAGVEINHQAIELARLNAAANGIVNCTFTIGKSEAIFENLTFPGNESAMIIDPPRAGCDELFLRQLLEFGPKRLVYVSCDPSTQARDLKILREGGYRIERIQPFDLFPQTRHIENVATLSRAE
ncbi:class I SAM-dependent RNA methyltransferase [Cerasicoccus fimbriatus]|uniref:class I SAM-dependent RNA methyltransferase n=1 Tax=Cerasicoccus fimbriatus TaxID=3014554 RepID=UPI0022B33D0E|nr:class I SAM-dependent RNA methyltransferase [Cerasicoccus sp. TK19100]